MDQAIYAGTNFVAAVVVARVLGPAEFGVFALVVAIWTVIWVLYRAVLSDPYIIEVAGLHASERDRTTALGAGAILWSGTITGGGLAIWAFGLLDPGSFRSTTLVLACSLPVLLLQDHWRVVAFSYRRPALASLNDAAWAAVQFILLATLYWLELLTASSALAAWAAGAAAGCLIGQWQFGIRPEPRLKAFHWAREAFRMGGWFGASRGAFTAGTQLALVIVSWTSGLAAVGGLKSVMTLFGPLGMIVRGLHLPALPAMARTRGAELLKITRLYAGGLALIAAGYWLLLAGGGGRFLGLVFGREFSAYGDLIMPMGAMFWADAVITMATLMLRRLGLGKELTVVEVAILSIRLPIVAWWSTSWGPIGAAHALAVTGVLRAAMLWHLSRGGFARSLELDRTNDGD